MIGISCIVVTGLLLFLSSSWEDILKRSLSGNEMVSSNCVYVSLCLVEPEMWLLRTVKKSSSCVIGRICLYCERINIAVLLVCFFSVFQNAGVGQLQKGNLDDGSCVCVIAPILFCKWIDQHRQSVSGLEMIARKCVSLLVLVLSNCKWE